MKKIYSIVLMAAVLLIGTNVWATTQADIQKAINDAAAGETVDITLESNVTISGTPIQIYAKKAEAGKTVNLNLGGFTISNDAALGQKALIELYKGTLNITNGQIATTANCEAIKVFGAYEDVADWSTLNVGAGVTVSSTYSGTATLKANAISILEFRAKYCTYIKKDYAGQDLSDAYGYNSIDPATYKTTYYVYNDTEGGARKSASVTSGNALVDNGTIDYSSTFIKAGTKVYSLHASNGTLYEYVKISSEAAAFGAKVNVLAGAVVYGDKYGIKINGTIKAAGTNVPSVHVAKGSEVKAAPEAANATAVYSSGNGAFVIEGKVHGSTGVYVKGGSVVVEDGAEIYSDNKTGNGVEQIGKGSGIDAGGNAIAIEGDNKSYTSEGISVQINGGTITAGDGAYAVQNLNNDAAQSNPNAVTISGGTFEGGAAGCVTIDNAKGDVKVELEGGTFTGNIESLVNSVGTENVISEVVSIDAAGNATVVVGQKSATDDEFVEQPTADNDAYYLTGDANDIIKLDTKNGGHIHGTLGASEVTIKYLSLTGTASDDIVITVENGKTLNVEQIVMNAYGKIIVKAGGKLIVSGNNGIFADAIENILLETSETAQAHFLLNPAVANNRNPKAIVEFISKSYRKDGKNVYQRFGIPSKTNDVQMEYKDPSSSTLTYIQMWDYAADKWTESWIPVPAATGLNVGVSGPFGCFDLASNNAKEAPMTYLFKGALQGNDDAVMAFNSKFNPYANSYMAPIDIKTLLNRIETNYPELSAAVYVYKSLANDNYTWLPLAQSDFQGWDVPEVTEIAPMQAYMLYMIPGNTSNATVSYKDNVYDPYIAGAAAPARAQATKKNFLKLTIADEEGIVFDNARLLEDNQFSNEFDNGYDVNKYMNENVSLYVTSQEEAWSTLAADNVLNTYIGVNVAQSGVYTISVAHNGLDYALVDLENNQVINLENGNTYNFYQEAGQNDARFQVVGINKVATAIDNAQNDEVLSTKIMKDGVLYILKNGALYNAQGQIVK